MITCLSPQVSLSRPLPSGHLPVCCIIVVHSKRTTCNHQLSKINKSGSCCHALLSHSTYHHSFIFILQYCMLFFLATVLFSFSTCISYMVHKEWVSNWVQNLSQKRAIWDAIIKMALVLTLNGLWIVLLSFSLALFSLGYHITNISFRTLYSLGCKILPIWGLLCQLITIQHILFVAGVVIIRL
jgi:hypothetical protein